MESFPLLLTSLTRTGILLIRLCKKYDLIPESRPLTNTCIAWPLELTVIVGFCPVRENDSVEPISTLNLDEQL